MGIRGLMAVSYWKYGENILRVRVMGLALGDTISCGGSGHRLSTFRGFRLVADNHNGELGNQRGDGADGGEERSQDGADGSEGHGNLDERVAVLVLYNDALDVALVDQGADLIDEVAAQDMNFFDYIIETHSLDYVVRCRQVPEQLNSEDREAALPVVDPRPRRVRNSTIKNAPALDCK